MARRRRPLIALIRAEPSRDVPLVPASWTVIPSGNRWCTVVMPDGKLVNARLMMRIAANPQRAVFCIFGPALTIKLLEDKIAADALSWTQTWRTWPIFRAFILGGGATATAIAGSWINERHSRQPGAELYALHDRIAGFEDDDGEDDVADATE